MRLQLYLQMRPCAKATFQTSDAVCICKPIAKSPLGFVNLERYIGYTVFCTRSKRGAYPQVAQGTPYVQARYMRRGPGPIIGVKVDQPPADVQAPVFTCNAKRAVVRRMDVHAS
jgi:hypothetical protein